MMTMMRKMTAILLCALAGCLDAPPDTATKEQPLCTVEDPGCPTAWHLSATVNEGYVVTAWLGYEPREVYSGCNQAATSCFANWLVTASISVQTVCTFSGQTVSCTTKVCEDHGDGFECHDVPPLE